MKTNKNKEAQPYDRLFKENVNKFFIPIIERELDIQIVAHKELPSEITKTMARAVDYLCQIETSNGEKSLLHIEFQSKNDKTMVFRMAEYHGLLLNRYKLPIKHVVVYLGSQRVNMKRSLLKKEIFSSFELINLSKLDPEKLLESQIPEVFILALLGTYKKQQIEDILRKIIRRLQKLNLTISQKERYAKQLLILSRLRNLETETTKFLENMPITYDRPIEEDGLYQIGVKEGEIKGIKKGIEKGKNEGISEGRLETIKDNIAKFLKTGIHSTEDLSKILEVELSLVEEVAKRIKKG